MQLHGLKGHYSFRYLEFCRLAVKNDAFLRCAQINMSSGFKSKSRLYFYFLATRARLLLKDIYSTVVGDGALLLGFELVLEFLHFML